MSSLQFDSFHKLLGDYAERLPNILSRHHSTQKYVRQVEKGVTQIDTPFTVAICGLMKAGKSSLLNTLVKQDLAVTGVSEATATINWFKYREKVHDTHLPVNFRVIWKDKPEEEFPITEIQKWVGNSEEAQQLSQQTKRLEFFADADFLKQAYIVDTPGAGTTTESNAAAAQSFLSQQEGEKADAIIYVLGVVARTNQEEMLQTFQKNSRIPGASPYNSIAVIHRWETLDAKDPFAESRRKTDIIKEQFKEYIAEVIPVSAPLGWAVEHFDTEFWQSCFELGGQPEKERKKFLLMDTYFDKEPQRKELRTKYKLPWACLKVIINRVALAKIESPEALKEDIWDISGIEKLRTILDKRFFSRSRMIRSFGILARTLPICEEADTVLRNHKILFTQMQDDADKALTETDILPNTVKNYIEETKKIVHSDYRTASEALTELGKLVQPVKDAWKAMNDDINFLDELDKLRSKDLRDWQPKLAALFGKNGAELQHRIAPFGKSETPATSDDLAEAIGELRSICFRSTDGTVKAIVKHAVERLSELCGG
jgi:ribosome biogenesis GTPase A